MIVKGDVASKYKSALVIRFASKDRELDDQLLWKIIKTAHFEGITPRLQNVRFVDCPQ